MYRLYLAFEEAVAVLVVAYLLQLGGEWGAFSYPSVEVLQCRCRFASGAVELCQLDLGVGAENESRFFAGVGLKVVHIFDYLLVICYKGSDKVGRRQEIKRLFPDKCRPFRTFLHRRRRVSTIPDSGGWRWLYL